MKKLLNNFEEVLAAVILAFMTTLAFVNVVARYGFSASLSITDEFTTYFFVILSLLGTAIAAKRGTHLGLSLVFDMMPKRVQKYFLILGAFLSVAFCAILLYFGIIMVRQEYELGLVTAGLQLPEWVFGSFVPIGAAIVLLRFLQAGIAELRSLKKLEKKLEPKLHKEVKQ